MIQDYFAINGLIGMMMNNKSFYQVVSEQLELFFSFYALHMVLRFGQMDKLTFSLLKKI